MVTRQEQLKQLNAAIQAIETGAQEYRIGSRLVRRPDIGLLYRERRRLEDEMFAESGDYITVARFKGR